MKERLYVIGFTLAVTVFFGGMVATVNALLKDRIEVNRQVAAYRAVLEAFGVSDPERRESAAAVAATFAAQVEEDSSTGGTVYVLKENPEHRAFLLDGDAYWGPLTGVMAVDLASRTVLGIAFIDHSETPGLGARIDEAPFRDQFVGLPFPGSADGRGGIRFVEPGAAVAADSQVDMITGATETSRSVERIINKALAGFLEKVEKP